MAVGIRRNSALDMLMEIKVINDEEDEGLSGKRICCECIGEEYLKRYVESKNDIASCSYCGEHEPTILLGDFANRVEVAFQNHLRRSSTEPSDIEWAMTRDKEFTYDWERDGDPVREMIGWTAQVGEQPAEDIRQILDERTSNWEAEQLGEETAFEVEAHYVEAQASDIKLQAKWIAFEYSLKTEARYFSHSAEAMLSSIFEGIDRLQTRDGRPAVVDAGPGIAISTLYRARVFQSNEKLREALEQPEKSIGSPPFNAAAAGRMNARGISVFYGANNPKVALAEVRPPVGSRVAIGCFDLIRPLRLLDLTALRDIHVTGSIFDPEYIIKLERRKFLERLSRRITMPVMPDDETFDYLATQAIADYLATEAVPTLDGVIYPSAQVAGEELNIALFIKQREFKRPTSPQILTSVQAYTILRRTMRKHIIQYGKRNQLRSIATKRE